MSVNSIAKSSFSEYLFNFLNMYLKTFNVKLINVFRNVVKNIIYQEEKAALIESLQRIGAEFGAGYSESGAYPAWEYRRESALREKLVEVYRAQTGKEPKIEAIHAGLECGLFAGQLPGLDCVSFGPDLVDIHTTREKMSISSVQRTWQFLLGVLAALKD